MEESSTEITTTVKFCLWLRWGRIYVFYVYICCSADTIPNSMKKQILWLSGLMLLCLPLAAQVHTLTFTYTAPPLPVANAGNDTVVHCNLPFTLKGVASGGTAPYTFYWQPGNLLNDSSLLQPTANISTQTTFTFNVIDNKGCIISDQVEVTCFVIGVEEAGAGTLRLIPNPSAGKFMLSGIPVSEAPVQITCLSLQGSLLAEKWISAGQRDALLDFTSLPAGTYYLTLTFSDKKLVHKLIIRK